MSGYTGTSNLRPQGCGGASNTNDNCVSVCSNEITTVCTTDSDTYYIETPAVVGISRIDITPEDVGKLLSNDGENLIWQQVVYTEENFTTEYKESIDTLVSGDYVWKESSW